MRAGGLDRAVTIIRQGVAADDGYTTLPGAWATMATRKAQRIVSRGREVFEEQGLDAEVPMTFVLRDDSVTRTITVKDRVTYAGKVYDLKSVNEIGRRRGVELVGVAAADQGEIDVTGLDPLLAVTSDGIAVVGSNLRLDIDNLTEAD